MTLDPIHQFDINSLFTIGHIGGPTIAFTNSSAYMLLTVVVICLLAVRGIKGRCDMYGNRSTGGLPA